MPRLGGARHAVMSDCPLGMTCLREARCSTFSAWHRVPGTLGYCSGPWPPRRSAAISAGRSLSRCQAARSRRGPPALYVPAKVLSADRALVRVLGHSA